MACLLLIGGMFRLFAAAVIWATACSDAADLRVATFNIGATFGETFFIYGLGAPGTPDHETVRETLARIDADVVALQEIHPADLQGSPNDLQALAAALGYPHIHVASISNAIDSTFRVAFISRFPFIQSADVNSPQGARELTRRHPAVRVDVPGVDHDPLLISLHLKAGTARTDRFRRAIEMRRLTEHLTSNGVADDDNFVILGDFNSSSVQAVFDELPTGLPSTYVLGSDITFPVTYFVNPVHYFIQPGAVRVDARQLDGSASTFDTSTFGGPALDLILVSPGIAARDFAAEIYNSTLDVSNDVGLPKFGEPLAAGTSAQASDHYAVFADLSLAPPASYAFTQAGETVGEDFNSMSGTRAPSPWLAIGGGEWRGIDDGSSTLGGWRAYGSGSQVCPGFLTDGAAATLSAKFENRSQFPITALEIAFDAAQWRAVTGGSPDRIAVELSLPGGTLPLPNLDFAADTVLPTEPIPGGAPARRSTLAKRLWLEPGEEFELRFRFLPGDALGAPSQDVFINEFHYDNTSTDAGEFVEIAVGPGYSGSLSEISLVLYNGSNGQTYGLHTLDSFIPGITTTSGHRLFHKPIPDIQNGAPDGFAVVAGSSVLHFISYEGTFTATNGPALGLESTDIGVSQTGNEPVGQSSLGLSGNGGTAGDFYWVKSSGVDHSPGEPNPGQTFANLGKPPQGLAIDNLAVSFLTDNDLDGDPDLTDPDDDNDGQRDTYEAAFGSDPLNATSRFITDLMSTAEGPRLVFPGAQGIVYTVEMSTTLADDWAELSTHAGDGSMVEVPLPKSGERRFFRVKSGGR